MDIKTLDTLENRNAVRCAINTALDLLSDPVNMMDARSGPTRARLTEVANELKAVEVNGG